MHIPLFELCDEKTAFKQQICKSVWTDAQADQRHFYPLLRIVWASSWENLILLYQNKAKWLFLRKRNT